MLCYVVLGVFKLVVLGWCDGIELISVMMLCVFGYFGLVWLMVCYCVIVVFGSWVVMLVEVLFLFVLFVLYGWLVVVLVVLFVFYIGIVVFMGFNKFLWVFVVIYLVVLVLGYVVWVVL